MEGKKKQDGTEVERKKINKYLKKENTKKGGNKFFLVLANCFFLFFYFYIIIKNVLLNWRKTTINCLKALYSVWFHWEILFFFFFPHSDITANFFLWQLIYKTLYNCLSTKKKDFEKKKKIFFCLPTLFSVSLFFFIEKFNYTCRRLFAILVKKHKFFEFKTKNKKITRKNVFNVFIERIKAKAKAKKKKKKREGTIKKRKIAFNIFFFFFAFNFFSKKNCSFFGWGSSFH